MWTNSHQVSGSLDDYRLFQPIRLLWTYQVTHSKLWPLVFWTEHTELNHLICWRVEAKSEIPASTLCPSKRKMTYRLEQVRHRAAVEIAYVTRQNSACMAADVSVEERAILSLQLRFQRQLFCRACNQLDKGSEATIHLLHSTPLCCFVAVL